MYRPERAEPISVGLMSSMMLIRDGSDAQDRGFLSRQSSESQVSSPTCKRASTYLSIQTNRKACRLIRLDYSHKQRVGLCEMLRPDLIVTFPGNVSGYCLQ
jgi:hypothetical protein